MCLGQQQPKQPEIVYQGPSEDQIAQQRAAMDNWTQSIQSSNQQFQTSLQQQIDSNNAAFAGLTADYDKLVADAGGVANQAVADAQGAASGATASAASDAAAQQVGALSVTTSQTQPEMPETTESAAKPKKNKKQGLKISTAGIKNAGGSGVNLGI